MVDGVDDPGGLVDVADRAVVVGDLHAEEPRVAAEPGDPLAVRDRACRERRDEGAVPVVVADIVAVRVHGAVDLRRLRGEVGLADVAAGVDDGDLDPRGGALDRVGDELTLRARVLPLVGDADPVLVANRRLRGLRLAREVTRDRARADRGGGDLDGVQCRKRPRHAQVRAPE